MKITLKSLSLLIISINPLHAQEPLKNNQDKYFLSSDEFPGNPIGYKIIGKFKVSSFSNGGFYLDPDTKRGEKETMRRFVPRNKNIQPNESYSFTKNMPLTIVSKSFLGQYDVDFPANMRTDREMEIIQRQQAAQMEEKERVKKEEEKELAKNIPSYAISYFELQKKSESGNVQQPPPFELLGGFGRLPWDSDLETTIVFSEIPPGKITKIIDLQKEYGSSSSDLRKRLLLHIEHKKLIDLFINDKVLNCADLRPVPNIAVVSGQSGYITWLYFLSNSRLYAYCKIYDTTKKHIEQESLSVLIEALNLKYGTAKVAFRQMGEEKWVNMKWTNEAGTVCLVLRPPDKVMSDLAKMYFQYERKQMEEKMEQFKSEYGDNMLTSMLNDACVLPFKMFEDAIKHAEKQVTIGGLIYSSNKTLNYFDNRDKELSQLILKDKQEWEKIETEKRKEAAKSLQDSI
jgi:hypothetical protein